MRFGRGQLRPLALLIAIAAMVAAGWLTQWRQQDPPVEELVARPQQEVTYNAVGQSVRFMDLQVGQVYTNERATQATAARYLQMTVRLTTPRERSAVSFDCEAHQGTHVYQPIGLGKTLFPEPGLRTEGVIVFEFDPEQAADLRIVCRERSTLTFRESTVTFDPEFSRPSGRALLDQSAGRVIVEGDDTTEPIR